jgi:hypothetical protein
MVRALTLETSGSGTYTNASQGTFASAGVTNAPIARPKINAMFFNGSELRVQVLGNAGVNYSLLASTNQTTWTPIASLMATNSPFEIADTNAVSFRARYYGVSAQP